MSCTLAPTEVTVDGKKLTITFRKGTGEITRSGRSEPVRTVECHIASEDGLGSAGVAYCSPKDQFNVGMGRKLALKRALLHKEGETPVFPKNFRLGVYQALGIAP